MPFDVARIVELAAEAGIPSDVFSGWEGHELGLYRDDQARATSVELATAIAREKGRRQDWILDLGHRAVALSKSEGTALAGKLDDAKIPYARTDVQDAYYRRIRRVADDHDEVLRELAKR